MNLRFITSDCNCGFIQKLDHWHRDSWYYPKYDTDEVQAYLHYKYEVERGTVWFGIHLNDAHINNIFVNGVSVRRIG